MENLDVITIGEAMAMFVATETGDLAEVEHFMKRVAGAELNVATGLARLGLKVGWVSRVGNDSFGRFVLQSLAKEGIDSHAVAIDNRFATGFQMKSKVENGTDPIVEYFRKGSAASHLSPDDFRADYFTSARHLHLSGVASHALDCEGLNRRRMSSSRSSAFLIALSTHPVGESANRL